MARKKRLDVDEVLDRERAGCGLQEEQNIYQTAGYIRLSIEDSGKTQPGKSGEAGAGLYRGSAGSAAVSAVY